MGLIVEWSSYFLTAYTTAIEWRSRESFATHLAGRRTGEYHGRDPFLSENAIALVG